MIFAPRLQVKFALRTDGMSRFIKIRIEKLRKDDADEKSIFKIITVVRAIKYHLYTHFWWFGIA